MTFVYISDIYTNKNRFKHKMHSVQVYTHIHNIIRYDSIVCVYIHPPPEPLTRLRPPVAGIPTRSGRPSVRPPFGGRPDDNDRRPRVKAASAEPKEGSVCQQQATARPVAESYIIIYIYMYRVPYTYTHVIMYSG